MVPVEAVPPRFPRSRVPKAVMPTNAILRRKIEQSRVSVSSYPKLNVLAATHARETAARVRTLFNTLADVKTEASAVIRAGRYLRGLPTPSVLGILEVDGVPNSAAFHMEAELVSHVIDLSLGGDPAIDSAYPDRMPTQIDLAMCARFADAVLAAFEKAVATVCRGKSLGHMVCSRFETTPQMANIAPERSEVLIINQRVEVGESTRNGFFELVLPLSVIDPIKVDLMQHFGSPSKLNSDLWERHLRGSLMRATIDVDAVIDSQRLPLSVLANMKPGDVIKLGHNAVDEVSLYIDTKLGRRVLAPCRLGVKGNEKAIKLLADPVPDIVNQLKLDEQA
jgi:flagellar motor switch protein FliM